MRRIEKKDALKQQRETNIDASIYVEYFKKKKLLIPRIQKQENISIKQFLKKNFNFKEKLKTKK